MLHAQEHSEDVRLMDRLEVFYGGVLYDAELAFHSGVVHRDVEAAEPRDSFVDKIAHLVFVADVGTKEIRIGAEPPPLGHELLSLVVVAAGHDNLGTFLGEGHRGGTADTGEGAGDENNLTCHLF